MRIAMLGHKRMPSREGGVEVVVEELSTRMVALGHDVTVYSRKGHNVAGAEYDGAIVSEHKGVTIKEVPTIDARGFAALTSSYFAAKAAIADKPDVIHFHAEGPCAMIGFAKREGIRTVATIHGLDWQRAKWGKIASAYIKHGERVAAKHADEIIVLSKNVQEYFKREYNRETNFIPNGIDCKEPVELTESTEGIVSKRKPYVLFLGRIVPEKGIHYLIDAYSSINLDVNLVIAGGSSDSQEYFKKIKKLAGHDKRIVFPGFVQGRILEELYSNASVFVLPSDLEGMPISLLEAMSYGLCCLTSNIPECKDVLGNCGEVFEKGNVSDLVSKLQKLLLMPELRKEYGNAARKRVLSQYDWDSVVKKTLKLYQ